jgi:hypothetical protein
MAQDWSVHALVYFYSVGSDLSGAVLHRHVDLELIDMTIQLAADDEDFYGLHYESVSSSNAGGKCVTAGETAPTKDARQMS